MRKALIASAALALVGCGQTTSYVKSETTLGRVVVYRNGVAYFERYADVQGDSLKLHVPSDKVDDFLKSLTVVDAKTGEPAAISYPAAPSGGTIDMKIGVGKGHHRLRLSYVTEAPSWKPSYRVVVGKDGKVDVQGWAVVDNTSGEDWQDVKLGVGASSAMSFRFDLKGLRIVERETLDSNDFFAQAPPIGGASYGGGSANHRVLAELDESAIEGADEPIGHEAPPHGKRPGDVSGGVAAATSAPAAAPTKAMAPPRPSEEQFDRMADALKKDSGTVVVEGYATAADADKTAASQQRANRLRDQLVRRGIDPARVVALGRGAQDGRNGGARVVESTLDAKDKSKATKSEAERRPEAAASPGSADPIGTSHFESRTAMTVARGTSAMVSILQAQTEGEVVYYYDPETARGNATFPFRTLRFRNPTDSALESGPVTVFGDGRFVGEGLAEPIPAKSIAFVPFALDRQVVVERKDVERDDIAKIITVQRGVFTTEVQHTRHATFTLFNRQPERATVYLRHTVAPGYKLTKSPEPVEARKDKEELLAGAQLFRVDLAANGKTEVSIEEATPVVSSIDIRTDGGMSLMRAYLSHAALEGPAHAQIEQLLLLNAEMAKIEQQVATIREQMGEYRLRMDELHNQLFTLKAVKTAGPLMAHLEKKLQEISERLSKATVDVVGLQEKQMLARVQFQAGLAELTLEPKDPSKATRSASK